MLEDLIIYKKYNDFIYYCYILIDKIPKSDKFNIGSDIRNYLIVNFKLIIKVHKCKNDRDKKIMLEELDTNLIILKNLVRIIYKRKYISTKNYSAFSKKITDISVLVGGLNKKY